jgi:hypothetical protein
MPLLTQGKTNWKFLLIIVVLAAVVGGGILWCPKIQEINYQPPEPQKSVELDETVNWQTYRNEDYEFEMKYPTKWRYYSSKETEPSANFISFWSDKDYFIEGEKTRLAYISFSEKTLEEYLSGVDQEGITKVTFNDLLFTEKKGYMGLQYSYIIETPNKKGLVIITNNIPGITISSFKPLEEAEELQLNFSQMLSTFRFLEESKEIGPTTIWDCVKIEGCLEKWHNCENSDCISSLMEQYGASVEAINFTTRILSDRGYLQQFQEVGKIDLGVVFFPDRANTNAEYYLLNGSPVIVPTGISQDEEELLMTEIQKDSFYLEMENKYPNIWLLGLAPEFIEKRTLPNNNEEFVFEYRFVDGCRICDTEYAAKIGFNFDSNGEFLEMVFLQIVKGDIGS